MATSIWGGDDPLVAWNQNSWQSNQATVVLTGVSATSSVGELEAFPEAGWGSDAWGEDGWSGTFIVDLTGVAATASVGSVTVDAEIGSGWGRGGWNNNEGWGIQGTVLLAGQSATASVGSISPADVMLSLIHI